MDIVTTESDEGVENLVSQFQKSTFYEELGQSLSKNEAKSLPPVSVPKPAPYLVQLKSLCWRNLKNIKRGKLKSRKLTDSL